MLDEVFDRAWCWWHTLNERTQRNIFFTLCAIALVVGYFNGALNLEA